MSEPLDYPNLVQEALRGVVREAITAAAEAPLGSFYFYVAFRTEDPEVVMPSHLRDLFPDDMRIVLQHQFWDLVVDDWGFSVTLSFNGSRHRLSVPWTAVTAFYDAEQDFALRFASPEELAGGEKTAEDPKATPDAPEAGEGSTEDDGAGNGKVVSLDAFRKR